MEENDASSSSHLPHHLHTCCISGVCEEAYPRQRGGEKKPYYELATMDTEPLNRDIEL